MPYPPALPIALGDFNSNTIWGRAHRGQAHGAERAHTYTQYRHADEPYHIDDCFIPSRG